MVKRAIGIAGFLIVLTVSGLPAHPLHSSYADVTRERTGNVAISVRLFADDFGALLDSLRKSSGGLSLEAVARQYVQRHLTVSTTDGKVTPLEWCGMRPEQTVVWVCVRSALPLSGAFRLRNAIMFDRFSDQISIVRWSGKRETRTLVLSARVPEALLE